MRRRLLRLLLLLLLLAAGGLFAMARVPVSLALGPCLKDWTNLNSYQRRPSPLSSTTMALGTVRVKICYGRPSSRGRVVFGELVPYRTQAVAVRDFRPKNPQDSRFKP